jgi:sugar lactone lactonase YvrE
VLRAEARIAYAKTKENCTASANKKPVSRPRNILRLGAVPFSLQFSVQKFRIEAMPFPIRCLGCVLLWVVLCRTNLQGQTFTFTTLAGGTAGTNDGFNGAVQFDFPGGIAIDSQSNLFVADISNNTIRKLTPVGDDWLVTTIAGVPGFGLIGGTNDGPNGQFYRPDGVLAIGNTNLFVADHDNNTIRQVTFDGTNWTVITIAGVAGIRGSVDGTNTDTLFWGPRGIVTDAAGNLYVADSSTFVIRKMAHLGTNWVVTTIAGLASNFGFVNGTNSNARFNFPFGLAIDPNTNIYVADFANHAIRKIRPTGTNWIVTTIAGNGNGGHADGTNLQAQFNFPADLALDKDGNLYVSDQSNNTIRKMTPIGTNWVVSTIGGVALAQGTNNGVGTNAHFFKPWGIAVDSQKRLFIVDHSNNSIREGVPASAAPPPLRISRSGTQVLLSWPLSASSFVVESSSAAVSAAAWTPMTNAIVISGNDFWLTNNASANQAFYRLSGPGP